MTNQQFNDPDFDQPALPSNATAPVASSKGFFDQLDPKSALIVGLVGGIMALCTVGFFVLLSIFLKGGVKTTTTDSYAAAPQAVAPQPTPTAQVPQQPPAPSAPVNVSIGHLPAQGKSNAPVTIIEFADFRCPFCERFFGDAEKGILQDYVATGKVKFYFRHYAFLGPASTVASEAAECANEQGQFWKFHDWMYNNQASESDTGYYSKDNLITYATNLGLNKAKFANCLNTDKYASAVQQDLSEGQAAGVQGTPTIFINGRPLVGAQPYSAVKAAIDQALQGK